MLTMISVLELALTAGIVCNIKVLHLLMVTRIKAALLKVSKFQQPGIWFLNTLEPFLWFQSELNPG